jgi:hypothetical protein
MISLQQFRIVSLLVVSAGLASVAPLSCRAEPNAAAGAPATEWPQWGGSPSRNNVAAAGALPVQWQVGRFDYRSGEWLPEGSENILWVARLGSESYASPVVAGGGHVVA